MHYQPTIVFSLSEALKAKHVWLPEGLVKLAEPELAELENHGCVIHPLNPTGMSIASDSLDPLLEVL